MDILKDLVLNTLKKHKLNVTPARVQTLATFLNVDYALSQPVLEKKLGTEFDRVTIYRTLNSFVTKGLIHKIYDESGTTKFALCTHTSCSKQKHEDNHVHFTCSECSNTTCLDQLFPVPEYESSYGYQINMVNVVLNGICPKCSQININ